MFKGISPKRHAQAVFQIALEKGEIEEWRADLTVMSDRLSDSQLIALLENHKLRFSEKTKLLNSILEGISPLAMNLAYFLVDKNRLYILDDLVREYKHLADVYQGKEHVEVITAIPLDEEDKEKLKARLGDLIGKEVVLTTRVVPGIIGGTTIKVGDKVIDGSIYARLGDLKRDLVSIALEVR